MDAEDQLESALLRAAVPGKGPVIQLDGGRHPRTGLLTRLGYDPQSPSSPAQIPAAFSAMRVLDGQRPEDFDQLLEDWFSLLRSGRRITATGASGTRSIFDGEAGYPRTYVAVSKIVSPRADGGSDHRLAARRQGRGEQRSVHRAVGGRQGPRATVSLARGGGRARRRRAAAKPLSVTVKISAPSWIELDTLQLYLNGAAWATRFPSPDSRAAFA